MGMQQHLRPMGSSGPADGYAAWYDLSKNNRVLTSGARQLTAASSQYFSYAGSDHDVGTGDFSLAAWVYLDSVGVYHAIVRDGCANGAQSGIRFEIKSNDTVNIRVGNGSTVAAVATTDTIAADAWKFVVVTVDRDGNAIIYIDGAESVSGDISAAAGNADGGTAYILAAYSNSDYHWDGRLANVAQWNGRILGANDATELFNGGSPKSYAEVSSALKTSLVSWYPGTEKAAGADLIDLHGGYDLTAYNDPTAAVGPDAGGTASVGEPVVKITDIATAAYDLDTTPAGGGPIRTLRGATFNGTDQSIKATAANWGAATAQPLDIFITAQCDDATPISAMRVFDSDDGAVEVSMVVGTDGEITINAGASWATGYSVPDTGKHVYHVHLEGISSKLYVDGQLKANGNAGENDLDGLVVGSNRAQGDNFHNGEIQDVVIYGS